MRPWRNWQTRKIKDLMVDYDRGGSSPLGRTNKKHLTFLVKCFFRLKIKLSLAFDKENSHY